MNEPARLDLLERKEKLAPTADVTEGLAALWSQFAELVGSGLSESQLVEAFESILGLSDRQAVEFAAGDADIVLIAAWLLGVSASNLGPLLRSQWKAGDADRVRERFKLIRNGHARHAGAARRARAMQPSELRRQFAELIASGRARSKRQAAKILAEKLHKSPEYLERRARQSEVDTPR